jgi:Poly A polymerase head domain/Probable RNA and SrmB- binding site of polymerase A
MPHGPAGPTARMDHGPAEVLDHPIRPADIHPNVHYVCRRLHEHGHTALVVGGAVRDLLLGRSPKDFDVATSARPEAVKRLFRNARIIGRRFKLVQLRYPSMSVEVATFRGEARDKREGIIQRDNRYGTAEEDARRRDFTVNALTFDPLTLTLYDYVGGMEDLHARRIRTIKPPKESFREDPVRMMRAVRFQVRLGFSIDPGCEAAIHQMAPLLGEVKRHRLAEEMQRFITRGNAEAAYREFDRLGLLEPLLQLRPHAWLFPPQVLEKPLPRLLPYLRRMDRWCEGGLEPIPPTVALLGLLVTLGCDALRTFVQARPVSQPTGFESRLREQLPLTLSEWGLLNGQVVPAMAILDAARRLAGEGEALLANLSLATRVKGIREAVLLRGVLQDVLEVPEAEVAASLEVLPELPDLPILDHPRPTLRGALPAPSGQGTRRRRRTRSRRARRRGRGEGGQGSASRAIG